jgi:hypothetical protein
MKRYFYLTINPEALIASMLPPLKFGAYMAHGTRKSTRGQSIFFELDGEAIAGIISQEYLDRRCVIKEDGTPKNSVYLSIYNVLEKVPVEAFKCLYLTTEDGKVLEIAQKNYPEANDHLGLHLYQELCPVVPLVASNMPASRFLNRMTNPAEQVTVPKIIFAELKLDELATNPKSGSAEFLPYVNIAHLRDCLMTLNSETAKDKKTVNRHFNGNLPFRSCQNGFFVGNYEKFLFYPFPSMAELEVTNYDFWRAI